MHFHDPANDINDFVPSLLNPRSAKKQRLTQNTCRSVLSLSLRRDTFKTPTNKSTNANDAFTDFIEIDTLSSSVERTVTKVPKEPSGNIDMVRIKYTEKPKPQFCAKCQLPNATAVHMDTCAGPSASAKECESGDRCCSSVETHFRIFSHGKLKIRHSQELERKAADEKCDKDKPDKNHNDLTDDDVEYFETKSESRSRKRNNKKATTVATERTLSCSSSSAEQHLEDKLLAAKRQLTYSADDRSRYDRVLKWVTETQSITMQNETTRKRKSLLSDNTTTSDAGDDNVVDAPVMHEADEKSDVNTMSTDDLPIVTVKKKKSNDIQIKDDLDVSPISTKSKSCDLETTGAVLNGTYDAQTMVWVPDANINEDKGPENESTVYSDTGTKEKMIQNPSLLDTLSSVSQVYTNTRSRRKNAVLSSDASTKVSSATMAQYNNTRSRNRVSEESLHSQSTVLFCHGDEKNVANSKNENVEISKKTSQAIDTVVTHTITEAVPSRKCTIIEQHKTNSDITDAKVKNHRLCVSLTGDRIFGEKNGLILRAELDETTGRWIVSCEATAANATVILEKNCDKQKPIKRVENELRLRFTIHDGETTKTKTDSELEISQQEVDNCRNKEKKNDKKSSNSRRNGQSCMDKYYKNQKRASTSTNVNGNQSSVFVIDSPKSSAEEISTTNKSLELNGDVDHEKDGHNGTDNGDVAKITKRSQDTTVSSSCDTQFKNRVRDLLDASKDTRIVNTLFSSCESVNTQGCVSSQTLRIKTAEEINRAMETITILSDDDEDIVVRNNETPTATTNKKKRAGKNTKASNANGNKNKARKTCPKHKLIEGAPFAVDAFSYGGSLRESHGVECYFLTHFHSDHYVGLTRKFNETLYCSQITANLVNVKFKIDKKHIRILDPGCTVTVCGVEVTALDANHCPGSVMLLFRFPETGRCALHTGDFRAHRTADEKEFAAAYPQLSGGAAPVDTLHLDTTYCKKSYRFPAQQEAIEMAVDLARDWLDDGGEDDADDNTADSDGAQNNGEEQKSNREQRQSTRRKRSLIVVGTYLIGKEKVWLALCERLSRACWIDRSRLDMIRAYGGGPGGRVNQYLRHREPDNDPRAAGLHVLPLQDLTHDKLSTYLSRFRGTFDRLLAIRPSGWEFRNRKPWTRGDVTIAGVPYSEHSSYEDIVSFVRQVRPRRILATAGNEDQLPALYRECGLQDPQVNTIDRYFRRDS